MKKILTILFIYLVILFCTQRNITKATLASNQTNNFGAYYVYVDKTNLTTRNIFNYFELKNISLIYPNNNIYLDNTLQKKLNAFRIEVSEKQYIKILNEYLLTDYVDKVYQNGILIDKVLLNISKDKLIQLKKQNPNIKYAESINGKYI